jgi:hypothetical protein
LHQRVKTPEGIFSVYSLDFLGGFLTTKIFI